jgi:hypothetical protein
MEEKYFDKYGKKLIQGFYVDDSPEVFNNRFKTYAHKIEKNIFYFTGDFDKENGKPIFVLSSSSGKIIQSHNQNFCGSLRNIDRKEIKDNENLLEKCLALVA